MGGAMSKSSRRPSNVEVWNISTRAICQKPPKSHCFQGISCYPHVPGFRIYILPPIYGNRCSLDPSETRSPPAFEADYRDRPVWNISTLRGAAP